jgi:hypothetical protein
MSAKESSPSEKQVRYFKYRYGDAEYTGRFRATTPKQAATKAFTSICKSVQAGGGKLGKAAVEFTIKESTRGSKGKEYVYSGKRETLDEPMEVQVGKGDDAKTITYKHKNVITKLNQDGGAGKKGASGKGGNAKKAKAGSKGGKKGGSKGGKAQPKEAKSKGGKAQPKEAKSKGGKTSKK